MIAALHQGEKRLVFVNEQMTRFTGLPAAQLLCDGWAQVIHPDDLEDAKSLIATDDA